MRAFDAVFLHLAATDEATVVVEEGQVVPRRLQTDHRAHRDHAAEVADGIQLAPVRAIIF
jgi:hypothetical protein